MPIGISFQCSYNREKKKKRYNGLYRKKYFTYKQQMFDCYFQKQVSSLPMYFVSEAGQIFVADKITIIFLEWPLA